MKKLTTSLFSFLLVFGLLTQEAFALSMIPTGMRRIEPVRQTTSTYQAEKERKMSEQLWEDFTKLKGKNDQEKINASGIFDLYIDADDITLDLNLEGNAIVNTAAREVEENISGSMVINEMFDFLDEVRESSAQGSIKLKIIDSDFFINIENLSLGGDAEEIGTYVSLLLNKWLHLNTEEEMGVNFWEENTLGIETEKLAINSPDDLENIFTELLVNEGGIERGMASEIVAMFSFKEIFTISEGDYSDEELSSLKLTLDKTKFKYAMIKTGRLLGERLTRDELIELDNFLKNFFLEITFTYENVSSEVSTIGAHISMADYEDLNELDIKFMINYLNYDNDYKINPPEEYEDLNESIFNAKKEVEGEWQDDWNDEEWGDQGGNDEWEFKDNGIELE